MDEFKGFSAHSVLRRSHPLGGAFSVRGAVDVSSLPVFHLRTAVWTVRTARQHSLDHATDCLRALDYVAPDLSIAIPPRLAVHAVRRRQICFNHRLLSALVRHGSFSAAAGIAGHRPEGDGLLFAGLDGGL